MQFDRLYFSVGQIEAEIWDFWSFGPYRALPDIWTGKTHLGSVLRCPWPRRPGGPTISTPLAKQLDTQKKSVAKLVPQRSRFGQWLLFAKRVHGSTFSKRGTIFNGKMALLRKKRSQDSATKGSVLQTKTVPLRSRFDSSFFSEWSLKLNSNYFVRWGPRGEISSFPIHVNL